MQASSAWVEVQTLVSERLRLKLSVLTCVGSNAKFLDVRRFFILNGRQQPQKEGIRFRCDVLELDQLHALLEKLARRESFCETFKHLTLERTNGLLNIFRQCRAGISELKLSLLPEEAHFFWSGLATLREVFLEAPVEEELDWF